MAVVAWDDLLNNFTKELYSGIIVAEEIIDVPLLEALQKNIDRASFDNNGNIKILIQTARGRNAGGLADGGNLPTSQASSYVEQTIGAQRILATCGLTEKEVKLLTGGNSSWGPIIQRTLDDMILDFKFAQNVAAHSNATGALAVIASATYTGSATTWDACTGAVISCDNEYWDTGIENTHLIQKDMWISIWNTSTNAFYTDGASATSWKVTAVAPAKRSSSTWAKPTGTFTIAGIDTGFAVETLADGDIIFLAGGATDTGTSGSCYLPMGLTGIIANNNTGTYDDDLIAPFTTATFQGLTRASYPSLCSDVWHAGDFSADADHTPSENWDLSTIGNAMEEVMNNGGKTRLLRCHPEMARCLRRLSQSANSINVVIDSTGKNNQTIVGDLLPKSFMEIEGDVIPICLDRYCPRYMLEGMDTSVMRWHPVGNADFRKDFGTIWGPTRGGRATTVEAGYEWWYELSSERSDWHFRINDLAII